MSLEFLSGLLLVLTIVGALGYMAREMLTDLRPRKGQDRPNRPDSPNRPNRPNRPSASPAALRRRDAKPVNEHLIGTIGRVVSSDDDDERPMKVRLGFELWPARTNSPDEMSFPVGTEIQVTDVRGPIVFVRRSESTV